MTSAWRKWTKTSPSVCAGRAVDEDRIVVEVQIARSLKNVLTGRAVTGTGTGSFIIRIGSFSCEMIAAGLPLTVLPAFDIFSLLPT